MKNSKNSSTNIDQAYKQLQHLVSQFEQGEIPLELAVDKFKEGVGLARQIKKQLSAIEAQITEIKTNWQNEE